MVDGLISLTRNRRNFGVLSRLLIFARVLRRGNQRMLNRFGSGDGFTRAGRLRLLCNKPKIESQKGQKGRTRARARRIPFETSKRSPAALRLMVF
jgi:hypothetical protein